MTLHEEVQAKTYYSYVEARTSNVAKPGLRYAPIASQPATASPLLHGDKIAASHIAEPTAHAVGSAMYTAGRWRNMPA